MKQKITINHKVFTIFGCALAAILFILSCVFTQAEPKQMSDMSTINDMPLKHIEIFNN